MITVVDSPMGSGKSSYAIQKMNQEKDKVFIYVTLQMKDGSECRLHGPWNSNKEAFERDTGISY